MHYYLGRSNILGTGKSFFSKKPSLIADAVVEEAKLLLLCWRCRGAVSDRGKFKRHLPGRPDTI